MDAADGPLLAVRGVSVTFGGMRAVDDLSFDVRAGELVALVGPNGAGKTTMLNAISGFAPARGSIRFGGRELTTLPAYRRASLGIGRTFQNLQIFGHMTALENVLVGMHTLSARPLLEIFGLARRQERETRQRAVGFLAQIGIEEYAQRTAETLPFGVQKLLGVARALAHGRRLLLLDEPAAGLLAGEAGELARTIRGLADSGLAVILVEHNMRLVSGISDRLVVMQSGCKLAEGPPAEVLTRPAVIEAYLGSSGAGPEEVAHGSPIGP